MSPSPHDVRPVGRTGLALPVLGLGTAPLGWLFEEVGDEQAAATVHHALASGIGYIDTAPSYGVGRAEERVGRAIAEAVPVPVLSTKVGHLLRPRPANRAPEFPGAPDLVSVEGWEAGDIRESVEGSLERLGVDALEILLVHDPDFAEAQVTRSAWPAMRALREEGLVKAIGFGMNSVDVPTRFVENLDVDVVLIAGRYNLLDTRAAETLLPACLARGTSVICGGVLSTGILARGDRSAPYDYGTAPDAVLRRVEAIHALCGDHGIAIAAAALQFPLRHPAVASVVVGMRSPAEVDANVEALEADVPGAFWRDLDALLGTI